VVGLTELESVTSCVSSRRSNQLSYKPLTEIQRLYPQPSDQLSYRFVKCGAKL
jgi:hypothetical protein